MGYQSSNYAPCFNRSDFTVVRSYIELPWYIITCGSQHGTVTLRKGTITLIFSKKPIPLVALPIF